MARREDRSLPSRPNEDARSPKKLDKGKGKEVLRELESPSPSHEEYLRYLHFDPNQPSTSEAARKAEEFRRLIRHGGASSHLTQRRNRLPPVLNAGSKDSLTAQELNLSAAQRELITGHLRQMVSRAAELRNRTVLFKKPTSMQVQYAKKQMDKEGRTLVSHALQAKIQGTVVPGLDITLSTEQALTAWLSIQHARLSTHGQGDRHDYKVKQAYNIAHFGFGLLAVPLIGIGILMAKAARTDFKNDRRTYYSSAYRPEYGEAFTAFMKMLSSSGVSDEHKLRVARALVDDHLRRLKNIVPEHAKDIEAAMTRYLAESNPNADNMPLSASADADLPYRGVIAYAASRAWTKKLSEAQCNELLQRARAALGTRQHQMKLAENPAGTSAKNRKLLAEEPAGKIVRAAPPARSREGLQKPSPTVADALTARAPHAGDAQVAINAARGEGPSLIPERPPKPFAGTSSVPVELDRSSRKWNAGRPVMYSYFGAVASFKNQGYASINRDLRAGVHNHDAIRLREELQRLSQQGTYYGISFRGSFALDSSKTQTPYCVEGGTFSDRGFFSTTRSAKIGAFYTHSPPMKSIASKMRIGDFNTMFHVLGQSGLHIGFVEEEVLYLPETKFDVLFNGFDYRMKFYRPVLVEHHPKMPKGEGKYVLDILPPKDIGRAVDVVRALSDHVVGAPMDELKFHLATALQHLPYERLCDILHAFIVWPSLRIAKGESESRKKASFKAFQAVFPKYEHWEEHNLPELWRRLRDIMPAEIYDAFNEKLRLDVTKLRALISTTIDRLMPQLLSIDRADVEQRLTEKIQSELEKRNYRITDYKSADRFDLALFVFMKEFLINNDRNIKALNSDKRNDAATAFLNTEVNWCRINWVGFAAKFAIKEYPWHLEEVILAHNERVRETGKGSEIDLDELTGKVIRAISSFSTSAQVIKVLRPYLRNAKEASDLMIRELNDFFRLELKFPYQSFRKRYELNAMNYPLGL